jgi:hypothetical protein
LTPSELHQNVKEFLPLPLELNHYQPFWSRLTPGPVLFPWLTGLFEPREVFPLDWDVKKSPYPKDKPKGCEDWRKRWRAAREEVPPSILERMREIVRADISQQDEDRLRDKGLGAQGSKT